MRYSLIATTLTKSHGFHIARAISKDFFEALRIVENHLRAGRNQEFSGYRIG